MSPNFKAIMQNAIGMSNAKILISATNQRPLHRLMLFQQWAVDESSRPFLPPPLTGSYGNKVLIIISK
jgi:hypothetical protein